VVAALLAVAVVVAGVLLAGRGPSARGRRAQVVALSDRFAVALGSYDFHHLPQDLAAVEALSTRGFAKQYVSELNVQSFQQRLVANQSVARASVARGPFVAALNRDQADTLTVINQTLTGSAYPTPVTRTTRVELDMVHTAAGWRVDQVDVSGS